MPTKFDDDLKGNEVDDNMSWNHGSGSDDPYGDLMNTNFDDLDNLPTAGDDDLPDGHPSKKKKKSDDALDGDGLKKEEGKVGENAKPDTPALAGEGEWANKTHKGGGRLAAFAKKRNSKAAGGGILATILVFVGLGFGTGSFYLQDLTANLRSKKNPMAGPVQRRLERRRTKSALVSLKKSATVTRSINQAKAIKKLEAAGFVVEKRGLFSNNTGQIKSISKDGITVKLDASEVRSIQAQGEAFLDTPAGSKFISSFDEVAESKAALTIGKRTKAMIKNKLGITSFIDWIANRKRLRPSEMANAPPKNQFADAARNAKDTETKVDVARAQADADFLKEQGITEDNPLKPGEGLEATIDEGTAQKSAEYDELVRTNGGQAVAADAAEDIILDNADDVGGSLAKASAGTVSQQGAESIFKNLIEKISGKLGAALVGKIGKSLARGFGGLDLSQIPRIGCRVKGTLNFLANVRNVLLAQELASFAVRYFTISDHQRAGLVQSESVKLMSLYMSGATASGGMQRLRGNTAAGIGTAELSKASVTRADNGIFGFIRSFINQVPGVNNPTVCKLSNNFIVSIGATIIGGILGIATGGGSIAASIGISVGLTTVEEVTFAVAEPMILKSISKQVVTGLESGPMAGALLASGSSALAGMSAGANSVLPTTKLLAASLREEAMQDYRSEVASLGFFDRYFNLSDGKSLLSSIAFKAPRNTGELTSSFARATRGGIASIGGLNNLQSLTSPLFAGESAYAASVSEGCTDEWLAENNIETDGYCNILTATVVDTDVENAEVVLKNASLIDGSGQPTDTAPASGGLSFQEWVINCASGRAGIMYSPDIQKDGSNNPEDKTCIETGPILAGDVMEKFKDPTPVDGRSWFAKKMFPRVNAATTTTRVPGVYERYATWYGFLADEENLAEDINDELIPVDAGVATPTPTTPGGTTPIVLDTGGDTSSIPCAAGTDNGVADGYVQGVKTVIRICNVRGFVVNSQVSGQVEAMFAAAATQGINFAVRGATGSFRPMAAQIETYNRWCRERGIAGSKPPFPKAPGQTIRCPGGGAPGYSNHQMGVAMDLGCNVGVPSPALIPQTYASASQNFCFQWLQANAGKYGFVELGNGANRTGTGYEGWHWSINGK